mmetsp:Transcript_41080/g.128781  ORF Transcript_41080/g.128781 Transcript_41080/m.128781 type:complete len:292 (-) Transcript_41080:225-1100(-)
MATSAHASNNRAKHPICGGHRARAAPAQSASARGHRGGTTAIHHIELVRHVAHVIVYRTFAVDGRGAACSARFVHTNQPQASPSSSAALVRVAALSMGSTLVPQALDMPTSKPIDPSVESSRVGRFAKKESSMRPMASSSAASCSSHLVDTSPSEERPVMLAWLLRLASLLFWLDTSETSEGDDDRVGLSMRLAACCAGGVAGLKVATPSGLRPTAPPVEFRRLRGDDGHRSAMLPRRTGTCGDSTCMAFRPATLAVRFMPPLTVPQAPGAIKITWRILRLSGRGRSSSTD